MSSGRAIRYSLAAMLLAGGAWAQTPVAPANPVQLQPRDPNMPAQQNTVPEKMDSTGPSGNLSERLERSGGVITPPANMDPGITAKPPVAEPGTTPVIPPPGSPGGNPRVDPK